jgi:hypothetical protein
MFKVRPCSQQAQKLSSETIVESPENRRSSGMSPPTGCPRVAFSRATDADIELVGSSIEGIGTVISVTGYSALVSPDRDFGTSGRRRGVGRFGLGRHSSSCKDL